MRSLLVILLSFVFLSSCQKYPEGPILSLHSKESRVAHSWSCEKALVNTLESTPYYSNYSYTYGADKSYTENNGYNILKGTWELTTQEDSLLVKMSNNKLLHRFKILRLKNNSMWLIEDVNNSSYEWHLSSN